MKSKRSSTIHTSNENLAATESSECSAMSETTTENKEILALDMPSALKLCEKTTDIDTIIALTMHARPEVRQRALREICPCRVKDDIDEFWERVLNMLHDPNNSVRYQVLHTLCDGSPTHMEMKVAEALEVFNRDPDQKIRRQAHRALTSYRKTGKWNIL